MPIRMSGLQSGLDTEALVSALVSSYSLKKDNLVKAQTKLSWKQDKWKTMNTSIYSFYSGKLASARLSSYYSLKAAKISNSSVATVTAASGAVNGTQTLKVNKLAATGYLTGGVISGTKDGKAVNVTGESKLSSVTGLSGLTSGSINVSAEGKETRIDITADMTVDQFTAKLKSAGLSASFDATNQRFFISAKTSGADHDFSLTANDASGLSALQNLGLYTKNDADKAEYEKWAAMDPSTEAGQAALTEKVNTDFAKIKISYADRAKEHAANYNAAKKSYDSLINNSEYKVVNEEDESVNASATYDNMKAVRDSKKAQIDTMHFENEAAKVTDEDGKVTYDTSKMTAEEKKKYEALNKDYTQAKTEVENFDKYVAVIGENLDYVAFNDASGTASALTSADAKYSNLTTEVDNENAANKANMEAQYKEKAQFATQALADWDTTATASTAVRIKGSDSEIELNRAIFKGNTNNFSINGLTIQATAETAEGESVSITTSTDVDGIYNAIKGMFTEYNKLIKSMDEAYNASSSKGYEPLTSTEKEAMTDDEVKLWEEKIKNSLLRKDSTLGSAATSLKNDMMSSFEINGKTYSLASFGIGTLGYFTSGDNEKGVVHIDGDSEDSSTAGNTDKLRAMIANDPETVISFFSQLSTKVYTDLGNRMASSSVSSAYTIYNDKEMATEYSSYNTKISDQEDKVSTWEDYYYKKFSAMESALASLNSQSSSLSGLLGS